MILYIRFITWFREEKLIHVVSSDVNGRVLTYNVGNVSSAGWVELILTL